MPAQDDGLDIARAVLSPKELVGAEWNPNEMSKEEFGLLCETIEEVGFLDPPTVAEVEDDKGNTFYEIVGGHSRAAAAIEVGLKSIPVDVLVGDKWQEVDLRKFQNMRLNVIHGKMNPEKFVGLYNEMAEKYGQDRVGRMMGYVKDDGIKKMIKEVAKGVKDTLSPELSEKFEEQAREARTVGDIERIIQALFQEHGDSVKYNFMVFTWGGKEHIYVAMSKQVREAMKKIMKVSRNAEIDINEIIGDAIVGVAKAITKKKKSNGKSKDEPVASA